MEDSRNNTNNKKKKKNKKNKSKQAKTAAEDLSDATTVASDSADHIHNGFDHNHTADHAFRAKTDAPNPSADSDSHGAATTDIQVSTEEQIKQLQMDKEAYMNREIELELKISELHDEKNHLLQKEAILEVKIRQLHKEKDGYIKKEADLGFIISKLQSEKDSWLHREAEYKEKINQLVDQASTTHLKEAEYKEKINQLVDAASTTHLKEVDLIEKIKQLETEREVWAQKENSTNDRLASVDADNTRLCSQVMELEESLKNLLKDNRQLSENISGLQLQIQSSAHSASEINEMENQDIKSEMLAAQTMVKKLLQENAELVQKLNDERDRRGTPAELASSISSGPVARTVEPAPGAKSSDLLTDSTSGTTEKYILTDNPAVGPDPIAGTAEKLAEVVVVASSEDQSLLEEKTKPVENGEVHFENESDHSNQNNSSLPSGIEIFPSEEIMQIPLEESEASGSKSQVEDSVSADTPLVPISEAPLIGAPFRLISFMARYVSGADLVSQSS